VRASGQPRVLREIHLTHAPRPQEADDGVPGKNLTVGQRHLAISTLYWDRQAVTRVLIHPPAVCPKPSTTVISTPHWRGGFVHLGRGVVFRCRRRGHRRWPPDLRMTFETLETRLFRVFS
jgi:hypothetical protein